MQSNGEFTTEPSTPGIPIRIEVVDSTWSGMKVVDIIAHVGDQQACLGCFCDGKLVLTSLTRRQAHDLGIKLNSDGHIVIE